MYITKTSTKYVKRSVPAAMLLRSKAQFGQTFARKLSLFILGTLRYKNWGYAVALLVEALRYKPEIPGFEWNFLLT
jgi:hypothetical protein